VLSTNPTAIVERAEETCGQADGGVGDPRRTAKTSGDRGRRRRKPYGRAETSLERGHRCISEQPIDPVLSLMTASLAWSIKSLARNEPSIARVRSMRESLEYDTRKNPSGNRAMTGSWKYASGGLEPNGHPLMLVE
jgi:hypothetical protein